MDRYAATQRKACELANIARSSYRYHARTQRNDLLRDALVELAHEQPRYGYRRLGILLERKGVKVNHKRLFRAWGIDQRIELAHIQPGKPVQNAYAESFNGKFRDECLNVSWFRNLWDARRKTRLGCCSTTRSARTAVSITARPTSSFSSGVRRRSQLCKLR